MLEILLLSIIRNKEKTRHKGLCLCPFLAGHGPPMAMDGHPVRVKEA